MAKFRLNMGHSRRGILEPVERGKKIKKPLKNGIRPKNETAQTITMTMTTTRPFLCAK